MNNIFIFDSLKVFFKNTDYYGGLHPYTFLEWTSYVREAFFSETCSDFRQITQSPIKMMTSKINSSIFEESIFGDIVEAHFNTAKIKKCSFDVAIKFINKRTSKVVCETLHTLAFIDGITGQFTEIPQSLKKAILPYVDSEL